MIAKAIGTSTVRGHITNTNIFKSFDNFKIIHKFTTSTKTIAQQSSRKTTSAKSMIEITESLHMA